MKNASFYCQTSTLSVMEAASEAAQRIVLDQLTQVKKAKQKSDGTWVSHVDQEVEDTLYRILKKHFPEIPFLGEERSDKQKDLLLNTQGPLWVVDPLDGTSNYLHQVPLFCTSIALVYHQKPIAALIHQPLMNEKYTALLGHGSYLSSALKKQKLHLSENQNESQSLISMEFFPLKRRASQRLKEVGSFFMSRSQGIRNIGSAVYALALVAKGAFDIFYAESLHPWDKAAGILLIEEAGGVALAPPHSENTQNPSLNPSLNLLMKGPILAGKKAPVKRTLDFLKKKTETEMETSAE